jgi:hypothetical protein
MNSPGVLTGWKDVANYVNKGIRTVQRWEGQFGFPIRRAGAMATTPYSEFSKKLTHGCGAKTAMRQVSLIACGVKWKDYSRRMRGCGLN